jgi:hypothetical protein
MKSKLTQRSFAALGTASVLVGLAIATHEPAISQNGVHTKPIPVSNLFLPYKGSAATDDNAFAVTNTGGGNALFGHSNSGTGVWGEGSNNGGYGVLGMGSVGVYALDNSANGAGTGAFGYSTNGYGLFGGTSSGIGVDGNSTDGPGVIGSSTNLYGVSGHSDNYIGVIGGSNTYVGVMGYSSDPNGYGVLASNDGGGGTVSYLCGDGIGVRGENDLSAGSGVWGESDNGGSGVWGLSEEGNGIIGTSTDGPGVNSFSINSAGVQGEGFNGVGIRAVNQHDGDLMDAWNASGRQFRLTNTGELFASVKHFQIDDPLDPANKYLVHASVESSEMKNLYDGVATLDGNGQAWVTLPNWFEPLNTSFRYQLTALGAPAPNLYIAQPVAHSRFQIAGGAPNQQVSWLVTGIRQDAYARAHPMEVEQEKPKRERGLYLHPAEEGIRQAQNIWAVNPQSKVLEPLKQLEALVHHPINRRPKMRRP